MQNEKSSYTNSFSNNEPAIDAQRIKELKKNEQRYRVMMESIDEGYAVMELLPDEGGTLRDFRLLETNRAFEQHTGLKNVEGKRMGELLPELEEEWLETYEKVARTGKSIRFKHRARQLGNQWFDAYVFRLGDPRQRKVAVLFQDITDRVMAQEEREQLLREVENERQRLAEIFQHAPSFMCILQGPDHVFERANDLYHQLVGNREIIGKPIREALPEVVGQGFYELLDRVYETGQAYSASGRRVLLHQEEGDPVERYLDFVYQPMRDASGEITGVFVQGIDLTERKRVDKELKEVNETLEERVEERTKSLISYQDQLRSLASKLSKAEEQERHRLATELHDNLGQMLAVSKMKVDLLPGEQMPQEVAEAIEDVRQGIDEALVYTRNLMSDLKPPPTLDKEDVRASIDWVAQKMEKHGLEVRVNDDEQPKKTSEEIRTTLLQCVRELLFNVIKHTDVREAEIGMRRMEGQVQIEVLDKGPGFDPEDEDSQSTEEGGFGLFNIQERMDLLGGQVKIESEPETGTRIILQAPVKGAANNMVDDEPLQEEVEMEINEESHQKIHVLLADDHQMMREGLKKVVETEEDLVVIGEAADGEEAVELTGRTSPDVVVMDVNMPRMNGMDATKKIISSIEDVRVIGLSLHDHQEVVDSMRNAGASAYLTKNEAFETLCATIRSEAKLAKEQE